MLLLAQADPTGQAAELSAQQFGAYAVAMLFALAAIWWLIRDRARIIADRDAEREANRTLSERLVTQAERLVPVIDRGVRAIEDVGRIVDRQERTR